MPFGNMVSPTKKKPPAAKAVSRQTTKPHHDVLSTTSGSDSEGLVKIGAHKAPVINLIPPFPKTKIISS
jgi:hypothetical protein